MDQKSLWKMQPIESDVVYTPEHVAIDIINWCKPFGTCLDPCAGDFVFYNNLPSPKHWCEIERGVDFFDWDMPVDWIVGNPPYSIFEDWIIHSFALAPNVVYILPTNKVFQRMKIMEIINDYGGIAAMRLYGSGSNVGFPFGFSTGAFHFCSHVEGTKITLAASAG